MDANFNEDILAFIMWVILIEIDEVQGQSLLWQLPAPRSECLAFTSNLDVFHSTNMIDGRSIRPMPD